MELVIPLETIKESVYTPYEGVGVLQETTLNNGEIYVSLVFSAIINQNLILKQDDLCLNLQHVKRHGYEDFLNTAIAELN